MFRLFKLGDEIKKGKQDEDKNQTKPIFEGEAYQNEKDTAESVNLENVNPENSYQADFSLALQDLKEALDIQAELGEKIISPEDVFKITGLKPEEVIAYLEGEELVVQASSKEILKAIQKSLTVLEEDSNAKNWFKKVSDSKTARSAFVALMLLAKTSPAVLGAEKPESNSDLTDLRAARIEANFSASDNLDSANTYQASEADFNKSNREELATETVSEEEKKSRRHFDAKPLESEVRTHERFVQLEMAKYFDTDSDYISEQSAIKITTDFEKFLSQINTENVERLIQSEFKLFGSSDERPTSNWNGSNEKLTSARLQAVEALLSKTLVNYEFTNLPEDLANELRAKAFVLEMPISETGPEAGVTYITDLVNPLTNQNYTRDEVEKMKVNNPKEYKKLLDDCRKINFRVEALSDEELTKINSLANSLEVPVFQINELEIEKTSSISQLNNFQNVSLLFDNSPSVNNSYDYMAQVVANQELNNLNLNFATFSDKLDRLQNFKSSQDIVEAIRSIRFNGSSQELALSAAEQALEKMPAGDRNAIFVMTDEPFQDVSWQKVQELKRLAAEKSTEVFFYFADDIKQVVRQISLADLEASLTARLFKNFEPTINLLTKILENKINALEKQKTTHLDRLEKLADRDLAPIAQRSYQASETKVQEIAQAIASEQLLLAELRADWESASIERLFANNFLQERLKNNPNFDLNSSRPNNIDATTLGFEVTSLSTAQQPEAEKIATE